MYVHVKCKGHRFMAALYEILPVGELANGSAEYTARAELSRDGSFIGRGHWNGEVFASGAEPLPHLLPSYDDNEDAYAAIEREVRAALKQRFAAA
jgi:hypothetical protein